MVAKESLTPIGTEVESILVAVVLFLACGILMFCCCFVVTQIYVCFKRARLRKKRRMLGEEEDDDDVYPLSVLQSDNALPQFDNHSV
ncbi:unnamed protein product [Anisakis simplex]|uniref:ORF59 n=1 Tax=Anisakis simplex TaxID=6269 RepID=A0A0M3K1Y3_ANISI|nr:unnamed protein product [Anisakis simplex]